MTVVLTDSTLIKTVGANPGAIGYTNYGNSANINLPIAALRNADGNFVLPSQQTILAAAAAFEAGGQYPEGTNSWSHVTLCNQPGTLLFYFLSFFLCCYAFKRVLFLLHCLLFILS